MGLTLAQGLQSSFVFGHAVSSSLSQPSLVQCRRPTLPVASRPCGVARAAKEEGESREVASESSRREVVLQSSAALVLGAIFHFSGERPKSLGVQKSPPSLGLCPSTPNCISTSEEFNDPAHFVPPWTYNPQDGRGLKKPASQEQAMSELLEVIESTKPDGFTPTIITKKPDYVYVEYESPTFGFVDDVEFWFPPGSRSLVEYRSASRQGESDFDANRKRIRTLRKELEKKGWESVGF
eukprot:TRINITY_DN34152_c0_g1_i1.p1 TRINITY_DN34152_c0_g1~~TRINITY_DN34152_c0_g1_i1.p1  ORF type:complete len:238 (+),score=35.74 TRINITY_DN34152_c0_g1_i1:76-789(+)